MTSSVNERERCYAANWERTTIAIRFALSCVEIPNTPTTGKLVISETGENAFVLNDGFAACRITKNDQGYEILCKSD